MKQISEETSTKESLKNNVCKKETKTNLYEKKSEETFLQKDGRRISTKKSE